MTPTVAEEPVMDFVLEAAPAGGLLRRLAGLVFDDEFNDVARSG